MSARAERRGRRKVRPEFLTAKAIAEAEAILADALVAISQGCDDPRSAAARAIGEFNELVGSTMERSARRTPRPDNKKRPVVDPVGDAIKKLGGPVWSR